VLSGLPGFGELCEQYARGEFGQNPTELDCRAEQSRWSKTGVADFEGPAGANAACQRYRSLGWRRKVLVGFHAPPVALNPPPLPLQAPAVALQAPPVTLQTPAVALQTPPVSLQAPGKD